MKRAFFPNGKTANSWTPRWHESCTTCAVLDDRGGHVCRLVSYLSVSCLLACTGSLSLEAATEHDPGTTSSTDTTPDGAEIPIDNYRAPEERAVLGGPSTGRRLTSEEFLGAIEVATGVVIDPSEAAIPRDFRSPKTGFRNDTEQQILFAELAERYRVIAQLVTERMDWPSFATATTDCNTMTRDCQLAFVHTAALRILRHPISEPEREIFLGLFAVVEDEGESFEVGAKLVVQAMLQSPRFVYRLEKSTTDMDAPGSVDPYELATRLSFLIWHSGPDDALLALAESGTLVANLDAQVERMLSHERARRALRNYVEQWLNLDGAAANAPLADDLKEETQRFFAWLVWEQDAPLGRAFVEQTTFLTAEIASAYGLPSPTHDFAPVDLSGVSERIGFLTQPAFLRAQSPVASSTAIDRGLFMLRQTLCGHIEPPTDPALLEQIEEQTVSESGGTSQRERFETQAQNPVCASCHDRFDPLGFALENYAPDGTHITEDAYGNALSGHGDLLLDGQMHAYDNVAGLARVLSTSPTVAKCFVEKGLSQSLGRSVRDSERALIDDVFANLESEQPRYKDILRQVALHPSFIQRSVEKEAP